MPISSPKVKVAKTIFNQKPILVDNIILYHNTRIFFDQTFIDFPSISVRAGKRPYPLHFLFSVKNQHFPSIPSFHLQPSPIHIDDIYFDVEREPYW